ncbi:two component transcriptional regulator, LuxR family [Sphingomonas laterariae]|uniref:Two component transcriptional regulator, LuxR family n=1 Tax=Edaphosphingomonas laterariae TaxID=861865 RepID=A0A239DJ23_9SPHN|nr:response regulator transcription factor [Sphingomonas laterariae]SNS31713.1 two component transcriptional regulator, LuxR family [Sphingomonas laterariae]
MLPPTSIAPIRLMTVDDHPLLRDGLAALIRPQPDIELIAEAADGKEALDHFRRFRPDVTLMDLQMPDGGGHEAIRAIRAEFATARIIVLTTYADEAKAVRALKAGAVGYLLKNAVRRELLDTIRAVHAGQRRIPPEIACKIAAHIGDEELSEREISVLQLAAGGNANKQIAWQLSISEDTVKAHMKSIFAKLEASDRTHAVAIAARRGFIEI